MEGVSYSLKDCLRIVEELNVPVDSIRASGGGARSPLWRQILADVFAKRVAGLENQEGSAYGAALLAMVGTGEFGSVPEACSATIRESEATLPRAAESEIYANGYDTYRALYPALRPIYTKIAG
jgi:xylulokinase